MQKKPAGRTNFQLLMQNHMIKTSSQELIKCSSTRRNVKNTQIATADPFENLKHNGKNFPSLRPIINKHRKTPSLNNLISKDVGSFEKPTSLSLNVSKSERSLPQIFQGNHQVNKKFSCKGNLPPLTHIDVCRNIVTPYFNGTCLNENAKNEKNQERIGIFKRRNTTKKLFESLKGQKCNDISFGETHNTINSVFFVKKQL